MSLRRFVTLEGWQRWIEVDDPPPFRFVVAFTPRTFRTFADPSPREVPLERRVFERLLWQWRPNTEESIYFEEGCLSPDADVELKKSPSLQGELYWKERYMRLLDTLQIHTELPTTAHIVDAFRAFRSIQILVRAAVADRTK